MSWVKGSRSMTAAAAVFLACGSAPANTPPEVRYGETVCARCNMIVSDERFATATILEGDRGPEARVFDDFNCQINDDADGVTVLKRWVHDHESRQWIDAESAHYVRSSTLRTPMASGVAAFAERAAAERMARAMDGQVVAFDELWGK